MPAAVDPPRDIDARRESDCAALPLSDAVPTGLHRPQVVRFRVVLQSVSRTDAAVGHPHPSRCRGDHAAGKGMRAVSRRGRCHRGGTVREVPMAAACCTSAPLFVNPDCTAGSGRPAKRRGGHAAAGDTMMSDKYNIAVEISENELRHLIKLHAERVGKEQFCGSQDYVKWNAERMTALLEGLDKQKK